MATKNLNQLEIAEDISCFDHFLSNTECDYFLNELKSTFWQPSLAYEQGENKKYQNILSSLRVSNTAHQDWFSEKMMKKIHVIEKRLQQAFNTNTDHLESWQATTYPYKGKFDYHMDAGYWDDHYSGDRIATFLFYLTTPAMGGETHFRAMGKYVEAQKGRLLVWNNLFSNGAANHCMIHSSAPLKKGRKTTLITWLRQKKFKI